jgi:hypothetical protein
MTMEFREERKRFVKTMNKELSHRGLGKDE